MKILGAPVVGPAGNTLPLSRGLEHGGLILLSGQLALRNGKIVGDTISEQTDAIFDHISETLALAGRTLQHIIKVTVWLTRAADFAEFNRIYAERVLAPYPVRSTVMAQLLVPGALVEIEVVATAG
ncbi:RidA family protein [soil metagenome]